MTLGGVATLVTMPLAGVLTGRVQPRLLMGLALVVEALALWNMTRFNTEMSWMTAAWGRVWQAIGIPFLFVPLTTAAYVGLPAARTNQAAAMLNVGRNLGGTIGISLVQSLLAQRQQFHQSRLVEGLDPLNLNYADAINTLTQTLMSQGLSRPEAMQVALGQIYQTVLQQASMMAFIDCFWALMLFIVMVFPVVWLLRRSPVQHAPRSPAAMQQRT
jgi:DHA2 family multidrug resistance protein